MKVKDVQNVANKYGWELLQDNSGQYILYTGIYPESLGYLQRMLE